jgi:hypothetical protein
MAGTDPGPAARPLEREAAPLTRQQAPTSMGTPVVTGTTGDGRPAIDYIGTPTGNAAPGGTAVVQGSGSAERARRSP